MKLKPILFMTQTRSSLDIFYNFILNKSFLKYFFMRTYFIFFLSFYIIYIATFLNDKINRGLLLASFKTEIAVENK